MTLAERAEAQLERYRLSWAVALTRNYFDDDADGLAAGIAFSALFSLMPILIVTFLLVAFVERVDFINNAVPDVIADDLPPTFREHVEPMVKTAADSVVSLGIIATVTFLMGGGKFYGALDRACARIFRCERQTFMKRTTFALLMMPLVPFLLLATVASSVIATAALTLPIRQVTTIDPTSETVLVSYLSSFALAFGLMLIAYRWIPQTPPPRKAAALGAGVAAVLMELLSQLFPLYLKFSDGFSLYGGLLAFILVVMLWLYLIGQIFVIGAEITAYRAGRRPTPH